MKRLIEGLGKNSPEEYEYIGRERFIKGVNWQDKRRWKELIKYFQGGKWGKSQEDSYLPTLLDIGCLDSLVIPYAKLKNPLFWGYGMDVVPGIIKSMNQRYGWAGRYVKKSCYKTPLLGETVDYAVMGELLEHLDNPKKAIKEAFRVLKPGGILAISVPYNEAKEPGAVDGKRHIWSYDEKDLMKLTKDYSGKFKYKILRSEWFPYRYCFPQLLAWITKK